MPEPLPGPHPNPGQRPAVPPGWPVIEPAEVELYQPGPVERRVVGYERYAGMLLPVYEQPEPYRVPEPVRYDPWPKRIACVGLAAPGVGWGGALLFNALAGATTALALIVAALLLAKLTGGRGRGDTYNITNHNRWWGRSTTRT